MHVNVPRKFAPFFEKLLTQSETDTLRRWVFITWESFVLAITLVSLIFLWRHRTFWAALPIIPVSFLVAYRISRRRPRRCPFCSGKLDEPSETFFEVVRHVRKRIFGGWFVRRNYWRELPPRDLHSFVGKGREWWNDIPPDRVEDLKSLQSLCHFHFTCQICRHDYQVKSPELKSFSRRLPLFEKW